jgi:osmotically inducible lipoprotein OsmB
MKYTAVIVVAATALTLAGCNTRDERLGGAGTGVLVGAAVAGPVGAVAGGVAGAVAGPTVARETGVPHARRTVRKKRIRRS